MAALGREGETTPRQMPKTSLAPNLWGEDHYLKILPWWSVQRWGTAPWEGQARTWGPLGCSPLQTQPELSGPADQAGGQLSAGGGGTSLHSASQPGETAALVAPHQLHLGRWESAPIGSSHHVDSVWAPSGQPTRPELPLLLCWKTSSKGAFTTSYGSVFHWLAAHEIPQDA